MTEDEIILAFLKAELISNEIKIKGYQMFPYHREFNQEAKIHQRIGDELKEVIKSTESKKFKLRNDGKKES